MKASPCVGLFCEVNMRNDLLAAIVSALGGSVTNMNNRNKILVDIVLAAGGTVTNPNDRNMLLQDWLDAAGGVTPEPSSTRIANANGVDQEWELSERLIDVDSLAGLKFEMEFISSDRGGTLISQSTDDGQKEFQVYMAANDIRFSIGGDVTTFSANFAGGVISIEFPTDLTVNVSIDGIPVVTAGVISRGGTRTPTGKTTLLSRHGFYKSGAVINFKHYQDDVLINEIPLTKESDGSIQTPDVGNVTATFTNYDPSVWLEYYGISRVVVFGASIMERSFNTDAGYDELTAADFLNNGIVVEVIEEATGGDVTDDMITKLPALISKYQAGVGRTMFMIHWAGGDTSQDGPYPGGATNINTNCRAMAQSLVDAGFKIAMSTITYRQPPGGNYSDEYNTNVMDAIISDFADIPLDLYTLTFDNKDTYLGSDDVHPTTAGLQMIREWVAEGVSNGMKGDL
ncbi:hypothetical protein BOX08_gp11 [Pseudoalteromonas phage BS5]|uniref:hypothetical protein n=1 Tax=Pseudoalteromonas phage BS5 TaxID=1874539 RepID=UPI0008197E87|nr:hypothetical protein BOX08_gp11 [Pseudoalteromonas phage BS5]ANY29576.1 hypothetical protein [Pseudoalteromonas phage BS5]